MPRFTPGQCWLLQHRFGIGFRQLAHLSATFDPLNTGDFFVTPTGANMADGHSAISFATFAAMTGATLSGKTVVMDGAFGTGRVSPRSAGKRSSFGA